MKDKKLVERCAQAIWHTREGMFPGAVRVSWEDATPLARACAIADAEAVIEVLKIYSDKESVDSMVEKIYNESQKPKAAKVSSED